MCVALATLRERSHSGDWLCLKNMHLVSAWLPLLDVCVFMLNCGHNVTLDVSLEPQCCGRRQAGMKSLTLIRIAMNHGQTVCMCSLGMWLAVSL